MADNRVTVSQMAARAVFTAATAFAVMYIHKMETDPNAIKTLRMGALLHAEKFCLTQAKRWHLRARTFHDRYDLERL